MMRRLLVVLACCQRAASATTGRPSSLPTPSPSPLPSSSPSAPPSATPAPSATFAPTAHPTATHAPTAQRIIYKPKDCDDEEDRIERRFHRVAITLGTLIAAMGVSMIIMALMSSFRAKCEIDVCRYSGDSYDMGDCFACGDCCAVAEDPPPKNVEMPHRVDDYD